MFWKNFIKLCNDRGTTPTAVVLELNMSRGTATGWKKGSVPSDITLQKIADYFGVTIDDLLKEEIEIPPTNISEREKKITELFNRVPEDKQELVLKMIQAALNSES